MRLKVSQPYAGELCEDCGREATVFVFKKYPAKTKLRKYVCGYHVRPYRTSEYHRIELTRPEPSRKLTPGYAPSP